MSKSRKNRGWTPIAVPDALYFAREAAEEPVLYAFRSEEERALWIAEGAAPVGPPRRWALSRKASRWIEGWDRLDADDPADGAIMTCSPPPCQRWHERRPRYRPPGEVIDTSRYGVEVIEEREARPFVERHHYAGSYPAARLAVGLLRARRWVVPELVGVAVFSVPMQPRAIPCYAGVDAAAGVELGRLVLLDDVPGNGESWFVARAFRALRAAHPEVCAVLSYSDPMPRETAAGEVIMPGHVGIVYQALNATYHGRSSARTLCVDREGRVVSPRALSKIRRGERGGAAAYERLVRAGAPRMRPGEAPEAWVTRALEEGPFRRLQHPGNHAYTWRLDGEPRAEGMPYPRRRP